MRWNILRILVYSHDGRRRDINLRPGEVNIITGDSHTGKSALSEVVDYALGASECHIPGLVRLATSWIGLLWAREDTQCLILRRVPVEAGGSEDDVCLLVGSSIEIPSGADAIKTNMRRDGALRKLEKLFGIGAVQSDTFGAGTRPQARISARNTLPYLLQDDQHIISKLHLLWGSDDRHRQSIIDTLPYFLGVSDEEAVRREVLLRRLKAELAAEDRRLSAAHAIVDDANVTALSLLAEASQVGLLTEVSPDLTPEASLELLRTAESRASSEELESDDEQLNRWYEREQALLDQLAKLRSRLEAAKRSHRASRAFASTSNVQRQRLAVVELFPHGADHDQCPLCTQSLKGRTESVELVERVFRRVNKELESVERETPQIERLISQLESERQRLGTQLVSIRESIAALVRESDRRARGLALRARQNRVLGRISLFLEAVGNASVGEADKLDELRRQVATLESETDVAARRTDLELARRRVALLATEISKDLPLEQRYRADQVDFDPRDLSAGLLSASGRALMRDIGSDEHYLTIHVSLMLAFHRYFAERVSPVPGFLLLDQPSRPYYPEDPTGEHKEDERSAYDAEVGNLLRYFNVLFNEADRRQGLQVLILEHAYFTDHDRFRAATIERWRNGLALIPNDWPETPPSSSQIELQLDPS